MQEDSLPKTPRQKATNKVKKKTQGGYYASFARWDTRGKSSKELKLMVEDMRKCLIHQKVRIKKHKAVIHFKQEDKERVKALDRSKIKRRDVSNEKLQDIVDELKKDINRLTAAKNRSEKMIATRDLKIKNLQKEKGKVQVVEKEIPTPLEKKFERILDKPIDTRLLNYTDLICKTHEFCGEKSISISNISTLLQSELLNGFYREDIKHLGKNSLDYLEDNGMIRGEYLGAIMNKKYYYLTPKGKEFIKEYKDWLSYSKSIITTK